MKKAIVILTVLLLIFVWFSRDSQKHDSNGYGQSVNGENDSTIQISEILTERGIVSDATSMIIKKGDSPGAMGFAPLNTNFGINLMNMDVFNKISTSTKLAEIRNWLEYDDWEITEDSDMALTANFYDLTNDLKPVTVLKINKADGEFLKIISFSFEEGWDNVVNSELVNRNNYKYQDIVPLFKITPDTTYPEIARALKEDGYLSAVAKVRKGAQAVWTWLSEYTRIEVEYFYDYNSGKAQLTDILYRNELAWSDKNTNEDKYRNYDFNGKTIEQITEYLDVEPYEIRINLEEDGYKIEAVWYGITVELDSNGKVILVSSLLDSSSPGLPARSQKSRSIIAPSPDVPSQEPSDCVIVGGDPASIYPSTKK